MACVMCRRRTETGKPQEGRCSWSRRASIASRPHRRLKSSALRGGEHACWGQLFGGGIQWERHLLRLS